MVGRLWRLRQRDRTIDAELHQRPGRIGGSVEIKLVRDGKLMYSRRWPTRDEAVADAAVRRQALERAGWNAHW